MTPREERCPKANQPDVLKQHAVTAREIFSSAIVNAQTNGITNHSAAIAFYSLLSIVPLALLTILAAGLFLGFGAELYDSLFRWIGYYRPKGSPDIFSDVVGRIGGRVSILGGVALITTFWFSSFVFGAIETAFNTIFRSQKIRSYLFSKAVASAMIPLCWLVAIASVFAKDVLYALLQPFAQSEVSVIFSGALTLFFPFILPFIVSSVFFAAIYKILPTNKISWTSAIVGSIVFCLLLKLAKGLFSWYVVNFSTYDIIFGSLEKMIILLIWVFYVAFIFLLCAELIASYERRDLLLIEKSLASRKMDLEAAKKMFFKRFGHSYPKGAHIFEAGERSADIFYILSGEVALLRSEEKKAQEPRQILGAGHCFGEMALITGENRWISATAFSDCDIIQIDAVTMRRLIRLNEKFAIGLLRELAQKTLTFHEEASNLVLCRDKAALISIIALHPAGVMQNDAMDVIVEIAAREKAALQAALDDLLRDEALIVSGEGLLMLNKEKGMATVQHIYD